MKDEEIEKLLLEIHNSEKYFFRTNYETDSDLIDDRKVLLYLLDDLKLVKKPFTNESLITLTPLGVDVIEKGGWIQYKEWKNQKDELELNKLKVDLQLAKETLKEFPKTKWFARIGLFIAIVLAFKELYTLLKK